MYNDRKLLELFDRVYNSKMIVDEEKGISDEADIKAYCSKVFGDGTVTPDPSMLHQFNNLAVDIANKEAEGRIKDVIGIMANTKVAKVGSIEQVTLPKRRKSDFVWSANGSGVDLIRVIGQEREVAVPQTFTTGFYYEGEAFATDPVNAFKELVEDLADAKVRLMLSQITKLIEASVKSQVIPKANIKKASNVTIKDFNDLASTIGRYGGRPVFIADTLLIDHIAFQQATTDGYKNIISDKYKSELLEELNITKIGRTDAVNLANPFIDAKNERTMLPVDTGYMIAGEGKAKPFNIVEYGQMKQITDTDFETGRVQMKVILTASIMFTHPNTLGFIKDDSIQ